MGLHVMVSKRRRGALLGGDEGQELVSTADDWFSNQGVKNPKRMVALFAPGWEDD